MNNGSHVPSGEIRRIVAEQQSPVFSFSSPKSGGQVKFRSQAVRDYACLLDIDRNVLTWSSPGLALRYGVDLQQTDFLVTNVDGETFLICVGKKHALPPKWVHGAADSIGYEFRFEAVEDFSAGFRLRNARDLIRYRNQHCPLGDRIRLLAALDEHGSLAVAECFPAFQESKPMPSLASLILQGFLEVDLDSALISPETPVRRIRD
jgi:hypothetical protein